MKKRATLASLPVLAILASSSPAVAQHDLPGVFSEMIEVRVINVEVVVTDQKGTPVSGLGAGDFRLLVDGAEVPIDYFTEVRNGSAQEPEARPEPEERALQSVPTVTPGEPVGISYLLFIDDFFALQRDRDRVLRSLSEQIAQLRPEDRMAIVAFDGNATEMLTSWTSSAAKLDRALKAAMERPARGLERLAELRSLDRENEQFFLNRPYDQPSFGDDSFVGAWMTPYEESYSRRLVDQIEAIVLAGTASLRSFAAPPGRKVMILLSGGWPMDPAMHAVSMRTSPIVAQGLREGPKLYRALADTANLLGYTVYPVDVAGETTTLVDAERSDTVDHQIQAAIEDTVSTAERTSGPGRSDAFALGQSMGVAEGMPIVSEPFREYGTQASLHFIAGQTGGRALINAQRDAALTEVVRDTRSYYWLGFTPPRNEDDQRHDIQVEVLTPGLEIRSREGFLDFSRQAEVSMMVESSLLFGGGPSNRTFQVTKGELEKAGRGRVRLPVTLIIPLENVTMLPYGAQYVGSLELRVGALSESGERSEIAVIPVQLSGDSEPQPGQYARYDTALELRRAPHDLVLALYDLPSGTILSTRLRVEP